MKGLLSVSFGTSYADTRVKTIDAVDGKLASAFPDRSFYSAWTSSRIMAKVLAERGERHDSLAEAFERLSADGVDDLVVASTCLMNGNETRKIAEAAREWASTGGRVAYVAEPLLSSPEDHAAMARAIADQFASVPGTDAVLLMGHGSPFGSNRLYSDLQDALHALGKDWFFVATVEGEPTFEDAVSLLEKRGADRVVLAPLMIVAGDHARNDLAGDDEDSWASMLGARGFETEAVLKGLGEYAAVQQLVVDHARAAEARGGEGR